MTLALPLARPARPAPARVLLRCDLCGIPSNVGTAILRFALLKAMRRKDGKSTSRGAGTLLLCERCWRNGPGKRRLMRHQLPAAEL